MLFIVWYIIALPLDDISLPSPIAVVSSFFHMLMSGELLLAAYSSAYTFLIGFLFSLIVGIPLGIAMGLFKGFGTFGGFYVTIFWATPSIALLPLLVTWFGLTLTTKLVIVILSAVFPIIINTQTGVENVDYSFREVVRAFNGTKWEELKYVILPSAVPYIMSGVQIGVGRAVIGVVVAELFTSVSGLGATMTFYSNQFQMDKYFAGLIMFVIFSLVVTLVVKWLEGYMGKWRR